MVVESIYPIRIFGGIALYLLDVVFLGAEKLTLLIYLLYMALPTLVCHFEVLLPVRGLKESLTGVVFYPYFVTSVNLL